MRKNYTFYFVLLIVPILGFLFISSSGGMSGGLSGSPGDSGNTCSQCHNGGNFNAVANISSNIPASGYVAGNVYSVTLSVVSSSSKHGFQLTAENQSGSKMGTFSAGTGSQTVNSSKAVTHTSAGTSQTSWTFNWTAPSTANSSVVFYAAVNATNSNFNSTGDQVVTTQRVFEALSNENILSNKYKLYPNPTVDIININGLDNAINTQISILNYFGQTLKVIDLKANQSSIEVSDLEPGMYFLLFKNESQKSITTFVKM